MENIESKISESKIKIARDNGKTIQYYMYGKWHDMDDNDILDFDIFYYRVKPDETTDSAWISKSSLVWLREVTLKPRKCKAIQWDERCCTEMKQLCGDACQITYEYATAIGEYMMLKIYDSVVCKMVVVPVGDYVVELEPEFFTVVEQKSFADYFE